ncbi:MAG: hypothetical protein JRE40_02175 [Deltaproteobacteria bacterium]|nr:hypothetical protein [Deltaproteobacteria bacterium]
MGILNINDVTVGMVLAQAAKNKNGTVILGEGSALTERHITSFKTWGVTEVDIQGVDTDQLLKEAMDALSSDVVESIEIELDALFPPVETNPVMKELYKIVKKMHLKQAVLQTSGDTDAIAKD